MGKRKRGRQRPPKRNNHKAKRRHKPPHPTGRTPSTRLDILRRRRALPTRKHRQVQKYYTAAGAGGVVAFGFLKGILQRALEDASQAAGARLEHWTLHLALWLAMLLHTRN